MKSPRNGRMVGPRIAEPRRNQRVDDRRRRDQQGVGPARMPAQESIDRLGPLVDGIAKAGLRPAPARDEALGPEPACQPQHHQSRTHAPELDPTTGQHDRLAPHRVSRHRP